MLEQSWAYTEGSQPTKKVQIWEKEEQEGLEEAKRIKSICDLMKKTLDFGLENIKSDIGTSKLDQLANALFKMKIINTKTITFSGYLHSMKPMAEDHNGIQNVVKIYRNVCDQICPDLQFVQKFVKMFTTNPELRPEVNFFSNNSLI